MEKVKATSYAMGVAIHSITFEADSLRAAKNHRKLRALRPGAHTDGKLTSAIGIRRV